MIDQHNYTVPPLRRRYRVFLSNGRSVARAFCLLSVVCTNGARARRRPASAPAPLCQPRPLQTTLKTTATRVATRGGNAQKQASQSKKRRPARSDIYDITSHGCLSPSSSSPHPTPPHPVIPPSGNTRLTAHCTTKVACVFCVAQTGAEKYGDTQQQQLLQYYDYSTRSILVEGFRGRQSSCASCPTPLNQLNVSASSPPTCSDEGASL